MTAEEFRQLALAFPGAVESSHMNHPDFRVGGKVFATLGYPDEGWGMVKLTPKDQGAFIKKAPRAFIPCSGAWGKQGSTNVNLAVVTKVILRSALDAAWRNVAEGKRRSPSKPI